MTDIELRLTADVAQATKGVSGFRKEYEQAVKAIEKPLRQIDNLQKVQESAKQASAAFFDARQKVTGLQQALEKVSPPANKLGQALGQAEKEMNRASAAVDRQKQKLDAQRGAVLATKQALDALKQSQASVDGGPAGKGDTAAMAAAKQAVAAATAEYEKQRTTLAAHQQALAASRASVKVLGDEYEAAAQPVRILEAELSKAERNLARTTQEFDRQKTKVREQRAELKAAGVDTRNLAGEQQRLQAEMAKAQLDGRRTEAVQGIRAQSAALGQLAREQRQANLEQAKADFGITRARQYESALAEIRTQYQLLRNSGKLTASELAIAQRAYTQRVNETRNAMSALAGEQQRVRGGGSMLPGLVSGVGAAYAAGAALKGIAAQADAYNLMNARLKLATDSQEEFTTAQTELARIAQATQAPISSLVTLYNRISRPLKEAGRSQADIVKVTEAVATSFRVSGATAQEAENGVIQFAQALGAGALRGEEFNSVAEQAPRLMQALAASIGVPVGALKDMAAEGQLTADVVSEALVSQLDVLRKEAATLPETVGGAMTALSDQWNKAIGQADVQPLIDSINQLADTVSDPATVESLIALAGAITTLGSALVTGADWFVAFGKELGYVAARATGASDKILEVERSIRILEAAEKGTGLADLFQSDEEIKQNLARARADYAKLLELQSGYTAEAKGLAEKGQQATTEIQNKQLAADWEYIAANKTLQDAQVKAAEDKVKALVAAEKKAISELDKVKKDRLDIEKRYSTALAELGGTGEASYSSAQSLKVGARNALQAGDVAGAQAQAQAALKMLQDLAAAGENSYGFSGFIQELQAIELAANDIEQTRAEDKITAIGISMATLKEDAKKLENMPVSVEMDEASLEGVRTLIQKLAEQLGNTEIVLPVRAVVTGLPAGTTSALDAGLNPDGFAGGGWTGPGSKYQPAGIVHADEHVQPKRIVNEPGALSFLEQIRRNGFRNTISQLQASMASRLAGYAEGGPVSERALPAIPTMNPALMATAAPDTRVPANLYLYGDKDPVSVMVERDSFDRLLRRTALKSGRT